MTGRPWAIYVLLDPRTKEPRYIGWASSPKDRLRGHLAEARRGRRATHKLTWIRALLRDGLRPLVVVLERGDGDRWAGAERSWIAWGRRIGFPLTNGTDGGDGVPGWQSNPTWRENNRRAVVAAALLRDPEAHRAATSAGMRAFWARKTKASRRAIMAKVGQARRRNRAS